MFSLRRAIADRLLKYAAGLRFPRLLALTLGLLVLDLVVPDLIPLADEILLGLFAALLATLKKGRREEAADQAREVEARRVDGGPSPPRRESGG